MTEGVAPESISREGLEHTLVHLRGNSETPQNGFLVWLVGDTEPWGEIHQLAEFAQQLGAEGVDGSSLDAIYAVAELTLQSLRDLPGRLIGKGEYADSDRVDAESLDEKTDALDETKGLPGTRAGEHQQWSGLCFDRRALTGRRCRRP